MKGITTEHVPIPVWGESVDEQALIQARNLAILPFAVRHIAAARSSVVAPSEVLHHLEW